MSGPLIALGLMAVLLILALIYDNRDHDHIWRDDD